MEFYIQNEKFGIVNCNFKKTNTEPIILIECDKFFDCISASANIRSNKQDVVDLINKILDYAILHIPTNSDLYSLHISYSPNNENVIIKSKSEAFMCINDISDISNCVIIYSENDAYIDNEMQHASNILYSNKSIDIDNIKKLLNSINNNGNTTYAP